MLATRVIPCLDVENGRVVKGRQFENLIDSGCPIELARTYEAQGADELAVLDIVATLEQRQTQIQLVRDLRRSLSIPLLVGGGVRSMQDATDLLEAGADKIALNSAAVFCPDLISEIAQRFGRQCTVLAIDVMLTPKGYQVVTHSGQTETGIDAIAWAKLGVTLGAGEILLTGIGQDGTKCGYDLELLRQVSDAVDVPVIASGGAGRLEDFVDALAAGASAVLAASVFHSGVFSIAQVKSFLKANGFKVRL